MTRPLLLLAFASLVFLSPTNGLPVRGCEVPSPLDKLPDVVDLTKEKVKELFDVFNDLFEKKYETEELKKKAIANFGDNLKVIVELNKRYSGDNVSFGVNEFDHMSDEEYRVAMLTQKPDFNTPDGYGTAAPAAATSTSAPPSDAPPTSSPSDCGIIQNGTRFSIFAAAPPASLDWRTQKNIVGPVRNQGGCGCCWAFSSVAMIQSANAIRYKKLLQPSEQQMCDCGMGAGPGCNGGAFSRALVYVGNNGISLDTEYFKYDPNRAKAKNTCAAAGKPNKVTISAAWNIYPATADNIKATVAAYGPVVVGFRVGQAFRHYSKGVFTDKDCFNDKTAVGWHGVTVVGYGTEGKTPYWIVKNSYGEGWGEKGYFRFQRGTDLCYIETAMPFAVQA